LLPCFRPGFALLSACPGNQQTTDNQEQKNMHQQKQKPAPSPLDAGKQKEPEQLAQLPAVPVLLVFILLFIVLRLLVL
jgi:hypothetical protein